MSKLMQVGETVSTQRDVYFQLVSTDGITPATAEAGGQPQISVNHGAWTNTGISTLTHIGNGRYYATITAVTLTTAGQHIETRYKSATTAECPGDTIYVVSFDPYTDVASILAHLLSAGLTVTIGSVMPATLATPIEIYNGDDYITALGNNLTWNVITEVDFSGGTATLYIYNKETELEGYYTPLECDITAISGGYRIDRELTNDITSALSRRMHRYEMKLATAGAAITTRIVGKMRVL